MKFLLSLIALIGLSLPAAKAADDYYVIFFSADGPGARWSHTFATFIEVSPANVVSEKTISWMPANLRVDLLRRHGQEGVNLDLEQSMRLARKSGATVQRMGPYPITKETYNKAVERINDLNSGKIQYKAMDRGFRPVACNCIHAVSDVIDTDFLYTGRTWGWRATEKVFHHYCNHKCITDTTKSPCWILNELNLR